MARGGDVIHSHTIFSRIILPNSPKFSIPRGGGGGDAPEVTDTLQAYEFKVQLQKNIYDRGMKGMENIKVGGGWIRPKR